MANKNIQYRLQKAKLVQYLEKLKGDIKLEDITSTLNISSNSARQILNQIYKEGYIHIKDGKKYYQPPERKYEFIVDYEISEDRNYLIVEIITNLNEKKMDRRQYKLSLVKIYNRDHNTMASLMIVKLINYIERNDLTKHINDKIVVKTKKPIHDFVDHFFKDLNPILLKKLDISNYL